MSFKKPTQLGSTHWSAANIQNPFLKKSGSMMTNKQKNWKEEDQNDDINNLLRDIESQDNDSRMESESNRRRIDDLEKMAKEMLENN